MFDIKELLFPNIITVLVQLSATGVIFLLYRKYLHEPVLKILDKKADAYQEAYLEVERLKVQQKEEREQFERERIVQAETLEKSREMMLKEIEETKDKLLKETNQEIDRMKVLAERSISREKERMLEEVEAEVLDIAYAMTQKVLEGYRFDEHEMLNALEKEMDRTHVQS